MNEKIFDLLNKISKDEKLLDRIGRAVTFDELYDIITSTQSDLNISEKEIKDFMEKYSEKLSDEQLSEIAGASNGWKGKIMPSVAASMLSLLTMAQTGASALPTADDRAPNSQSSAVVSSKKTAEEESIISRNKGKLLTGAAFLSAAAFYMLKPKSESSPVPETPHGSAATTPKRRAAETKGSGTAHQEEGAAGSATAETREELIARLPGAWTEYFKAYVAAGATAHDARRDAASASAITRTQRAAEAATSAVAGKPWNDAHEAVRASNLNHWTYFVNAWEPHGVAYNVVKDNPRDYFVNLLKVLEEQTRELKRISAMPLGDAEAAPKRRAAPQEGDAASAAAAKETKGSATVETKEELLARLPDAWERFWVAHEDALGRAARRIGIFEYNRYECTRTVQKAVNSVLMTRVYTANDEFAWKLVYTLVYDFALKAKNGEGFIKGFVDEWEPRGRVYNVVKTYPREYFVDLLRTLTEQTAVLQAIPSDAH